MEILAVIFAALSAVLSIVLILMVSKQKNTGADVKRFSEISAQISAVSERLGTVAELVNRNDRRVSEEMRSNRDETARHQMNMRSEMSKGMESMNTKLSDMMQQNIKQQQSFVIETRDALNKIAMTNAANNEKQLKTLEIYMTRMQESNEKKLDQMRETVDEKLTSTLTSRLDSSFKTVSQQLENLYKSLGEMKELSTGVTDNISSLNRVLTNVKARGTWAEVQLEAILDQTIPKMYEKNVETVKNSGKRVEFAVRIPSSDDSSKFTLLPIDSKFPMEDYVRLCDAADRGDAAALSDARKALEARVKGEAKEITKYINEPVTTPFAILYLPTEGLYAEIASSRTGLPENLLSDNIMIAGPTTITALLNSLSIGFKAVTINEKANEVRKILAAAKSQYDKFGGILDKAKKKIDEAGKALDDAQKRNTIITKKLKGVEEIDFPESEKILGIETEEMYQSSQIDDFE